MGRGIAHRAGRATVVFFPKKFWGTPRAPRQGAALSAFAFAVATQGRVRAGAPAFRGGVAGRNRPAEVGGGGCAAAEDREDTSSLKGRRGGLLLLF